MVPRTTNSGNWRFFGRAVLLVLLAATLANVLHTASDLARLRTNVLWRDQWWFLGELKSLYEGGNWFEILWSPYWGHRPVVPRLLFYLDARLFSFRNAPLLYLSWTFLLAEIALSIAVNRAIFGRFLSLRFLTALIVTLSLRLSSLQMENFIWALQVQYILVFFSAALSFVLLALNEKTRKAAPLVGCVLAGLMGSLTMVQGLLIWPVLALQAVLFKSGRKVWIFFLAIFLATACLYGAGYRMPQTGMGVSGAFRRPGRALEIALLVLAGPIANESVPWGVAAGALGIGALAFLAVAVYREPVGIWPGVNVAIAAFAVSGSFLTAVGRITPELLAQHISGGTEILPSRYHTFALLFWASLFPLSLWIFGAIRPLAFKSVALLAVLAPLYLTIRYERFQSVAADAWVDAMRSFDATGTSFLVEALDENRQNLLWPNPSQLKDWVMFAKQLRLTNFSEDRVDWLGHRLQDGFAQDDPSRCEGKLESFDALPDDAWRVNGWAWDRKAHKPPLDIILVDEEGRIRGLARSGIRHHDTGGHTSAVTIYRAGWIGYARAPVPTFRAYLVTEGGRSVCPI